MKKKIIALTAALLLLAGSVSASSINGDYKGNPIVKVIFNGKVLSSEVPAMVIDGVTMIPLRAIADNTDSVVSWNQDTYTVGIYQRSFIKEQAEEYRKSQASTSSTNSQSNNSEYVIKAPLSLYSADGKTYLGKLTADTMDSASIYNEFGDYGGKFSSKSIFNEFSDYGSQFSDKSAFNEFATNPPIIIDGNGKKVGTLTINSSITGAVSPVGLFEFLKDKKF